MFFFDHDTLAESTSIDFNERWRNHGDWEITGDITASPLCTVELTRRLSSGTSKSIDLEAIRKFRNEEFRKNPGLAEWGNILLRNNEFLIHAILRDENLRNCAINLAKNVTQVLNRRDEKFSDKTIEDITPLIEALENNGNKRSKLDAKRLKEIIPNVKDKNIEKIVEYLVQNLPGIKTK